MEPKSISGDSFDMNRREAIKRAALFIGTAISVSTMAGALNAQSTIGGSSGKPNHFSRAKFELVGAIADRILPKTDTPGALDVGVAEFVDVMYGEYMTAEDKKTFAKGLSDVNKASRSACKARFAKLTGEQQDDVLRGIAKASEGKENTFFHKIRELTITGYFTSETVMKNVLNYDFIPGAYHACVPISETGNVVWAH